MASSEATLTICDVAPRDGLQNLARLFSVDEKVTLIEKLIGAGLRHIEVGSFVNPARVPHSAGIEEVLARIKKPDGVRFAGLMLDLRGAEYEITGRLSRAGYFPEYVAVPTQEDIPA